MVVVVVVVEVVIASSLVRKLRQARNQRQKLYDVSSRSHKMFLKSNVAEV